MRFEFYHPGLDEIPKLSVDGTVDNSVHFSHWNGNQTPVELKADTSTEIVLNLVSSPNRAAFTRGIELVTNNHFDTDGVLSVWTMLTGPRAEELRELLIPAAEAGDFCEFRNADAVRASIVIQGSDQPVPGEEGGSPLAAHLAGRTVDDDAQAYELVLPRVEHVLTKTDEYENLWRDSWRKIEAAMESFAGGSSTVTEFRECGLSLVTLGMDVFDPDGFDPARHVAPATVISQHAKGTLFLIATPLQSGWAYRVDYPYYSWAETVVRPAIPRRDFTQLIEQLNEAETTPGSQWKLDSGELASAIKFTDGSGKLAASSLRPDEVANLFRTLTCESAKTLNA